MSADDMEITDMVMAHLDHLSLVFLLLLLTEPRRDSTSTGDPPTVQGSQETVVGQAQNYEEKEGDGRREIVLTSSLCLRVIVKSPTSAASTTTTFIAESADDARLLGGDAGEPAQHLLKVVQLRRAPADAGHANLLLHAQNEQLQADLLARYVSNVPSFSGEVDVPATRLRN